MGRGKTVINRLISYWDADPARDLAEADRSLSSALAVEDRPERTDATPGQPEIASGKPRHGAAGRGNLTAMVLLGFGVLLAAGIGLAGFFELESDAIALAGAALTTIGVLLMLLVQVAGGRR